MTAPSPLSLTVNVLAKSILVGTLLAGIAQLQVAADDNSHAKQVDADLAALTPFVSETTFLVAKLDVRRLEMPDFEKLIGTNSQIKPLLSQVHASMQQSLQLLGQLADNRPLFASVGIPISKTRVPLYLLREKTSDANAAQVAGIIERWLSLKPQTVNGKIVARLGSIDGTPEPPSPQVLASLRPAIEAVVESPAYVVLVPPKHVWQTIRELSPTLPRQLGGGPSQVLTDGVQWVAIGIEPKSLRVEVTIQSASESAARALASHLPEMFRSFYQSAVPENKRFPMELASQLIGWMDPKVDGTQIRIEIDGLEKVAASVKLLAKIGGQFQQSAHRSSMQNNFKQLLLAMHNYYDTHGSFPPAAKHRDAKGKPRLSWRVYILPYLEQQALFEQFQLDEPWDSPHNKTLLTKMPKVFASDNHTQAKLAPGLTTVVAPVGKQTIFGGKEATKFQQITDGTSMTVAIIEVRPERAVPWTAPTDYEFDIKDPLAGIHRDDQGQWLAGFADGSVRYLPESLSPETALYYFLIDDGHALGLER